MFSNKRQNAPYNNNTTCLGKNFVRQDVDSLDGLGGDNGMSSTRLSGNSLKNDLFISVFTLDSIVLLDTFEEFSSALGRNDVVDLDVNSLLDDAVSDLLVDFDTDSSLGDIENNTSAAMETLEGHTLVDSTVGLDINVVTILIATHISGERNDTMFTEVSLKHVTSTSTITVSVRHCLHTELDSKSGN